MKKHDLGTAIEAAAEQWWEQQDILNTFDPDLYGTYSNLGEFAEAARAVAACYADPDLHFNDLEPEVAALLADASDEELAPLYAMWRGRFSESMD